MSQASINRRNKRRGGPKVAGANSSNGKDSASATFGQMPHKVRETDSPQLTEMPDLVFSRTKRTVDKGPIVLVNRITGGPTDMEAFEQDRKHGGVGTAIGGAHLLTWKAPRELVTTEEVVVNGVIVEQKQRRYDARGELQKVRKYKVSFMNVSNDDVVVHATMPLTDTPGGQNIVTRAFGFKNRNKLVGCVTIKKGRKAFFTVSSSYLTGGLQQIEQIVPEATTASKDRGVHHCMCTYAIVVPNQAEADRQRLSGDVVSVVPTVEYDRIPMDQVFAETDAAQVGRVEPAGKVYGFSSLLHVDDIYGYNAVNFTSNLQVLKDKLAGSGLMVSAKLQAVPGKAVAVLMIEKNGKAIPLDIEVPSWVRLTIPGLGFGIDGIYTACTYASVGGLIVLYDDGAKKAYQFPKVVEGGNLIQLTAGSMDLSYNLEDVPGVKNLDWGVLLAKVFSRLNDLVSDSM